MLSDSFTIKSNIFLRRQTKNLRVDNLIVPASHLSDPISMKSSEKSNSQSLLSATRELLFDIFFLYFSFSSLASLLTFFIPLSLSSSLLLLLLLATTESSSFSPSFATTSTLRPGGVVSMSRERHSMNLYWSSGNFVYTARALHAFSSEQFLLKSFARRPFMSHWEYVVPPARASPSTLMSLPVGDMSSLEQNTLWEEVAKYSSQSSTGLNSSSSASPW